MRICDRCGEKEIAEKFVSKIDGSEVDLCGKCKGDFQKFLHPPHKTHRVNCPRGDCPGCIDAPPEVWVEEIIEPKRLGRPPKEK